MNCQLCNGDLFRCRACGNIGCRGGWRGDCPNQVQSNPDGRCLHCGETLVGDNVERGWEVRVNRRRRRARHDTTPA